MKDHEAPPGGGAEDQGDGATGSKTPETPAPESAPAGVTSEVNVTVSGGDAPDPEAAE